jgi:NADH-quinone oxidoreductase subunit F
MEPGSFKDRLLMEGAPHQLIEGMILAAYAIQASRGYIFLRGEYVLAAERLNRAIAEAQAAGYLGASVYGSPWSFELFVHTGAGRYICGEETALLNSLEGRRANPRSKPPFPQVAGLWGKPTVVNNVETLSNVPHIVLRGCHGSRGCRRARATIRARSSTVSAAASNGVRASGSCRSAPAHAKILEEHAGGMKEGLELKCWLPGGASTDFLMPEHLDLAMDFDTIAKAGSRMGTGLLTVVDTTQSIIPVVRNLEEFFARESCGWCTPCRDGLPWTEKLLAALERGEGRPGDIQILEQLTRFLGPGTTFCALAPGAMEPLQSALKFFRHEFEAGVAAPAAQAVA